MQEERGGGVEGETTKGGRYARGVTLGREKSECERDNGWVDLRWGRRLSGRAASRAMGSDGMWDGL